jgi:hypothetical protein
VGILQAILQVILQGAGPIGYRPKVLKGVLLIGHFIPGSSFLSVILATYCAFCSWAFCSWILVPFLAFVFLALGLLALGLLALLAPGRCGFVGVAGSWTLRVPRHYGFLALLASRHCGFVGFAGSWTLRVPGRYRLLALLAPGRYRSWEPWEL